MKAYITLILVGVLLVFTGCPLIDTFFETEEEDELEAPAIPSSFRETTVTATEVKLAWDAGTTTVDTYELERSVGSDTNFTQLTTVAGSIRVYTDGDVDPETSYFYRIRAINEAGSSDFSAPLEVTTPAVDGGGGDDGNGGTTTLEQFDFMQDGSYENVDSLGNGIVTLAYDDEPYDIEARVLDAAGTASDWELHTRDADGYVDLQLPEGAFSEGENTVEARYVDSDTGDSGAVGTLTIFRGAYSHGSDPQHERIAITRVVAPDDATASDSLWWFGMQDPDNPFEYSSRGYIMPATDGSLTITSTEPEEVLDCVFYSPDYEYAKLFMPDNPDYVWELLLRENSGASVVGKLQKDDGSGPEAIAVDDGAEAITIFRHFEDHEINATIFTAPPIHLSEEDDRYDRTSGEFVFGGLAGGVNYGIDAIWAFDGQKWFWDVFVNAGEENGLPTDAVIDLTVPLILAEHHEYVVNVQDPIHEGMRQALESDPTAFEGKTFIDEVRLHRDEIIEILNDPTHPLHDRVWLVLSETILPAEVTEVSFRDWTEFGLDSTVFDPSLFQPIWEGPDPADPSYYTFPLVTGDALVLYYNRDFFGADTEVPGTVDDLMALAEQTPPSGATGWLAYPQNIPFWIVPWLHGFGGALVADDGTPTLNTAAMVETLRFVSGDTMATGTQSELPALIIDDPNTDGIIGYHEANDTFIDGAVPMVINGDWARHTYEDAHGAQLGVAPLPEITSSYTDTPATPKPYTRTFGYLIVDRGMSSLEADLAELIATTYDETRIEAAYQDLYTNEGFSIGFQEYPALIAARDAISGTDGLDQLLSEYPTILDNSLPTPPLDQGLWEAVDQYLPAVVTGDLSPADAAADMQSAAEAVLP
jgi:maltose-binding protein MalE